MDGVKARLPEELNPREPKAAVSGLGKELMRILEVMSGTPLLEISDRLTLTSLSVSRPSAWEFCAFLIGEVS